MPSNISSVKKIYKIAVIPGDGIGTEITSATLEVLNKLSETKNSFAFQFEHFDWSSESFKERGYYIPEDGIDRLKKFDAIFFGAVGWPDVPDHISLWGLMLPLRHKLHHSINLRPVRLLRGLTSPLRSVSSAADLDMIIIRENSEGEYSGQGGTTHSNTPHAIATEISIFTYVGVARVMRFAFKLAESRPRKRLTCVTKSNAQRHGMVLWDMVFNEVRKEFPSVATEKILVDAMAAKMALRPQELDVVVATNLHADILSDLAAALGGSIGIAPSSNLDPERQNPAMFEPIHGSAPDIAGQGIANPLGGFWSAVEMLRWLELEEAAEELMTLGSSSSYFMPRIMCKPPV